MIADRTIPVFSSEEARDRRYAAWVAECGQMQRGMFCAVRDPRLRVMKWNGQAWEAFD